MVPHLVKLFEILSYLLQFDVLETLKLCIATHNQTFNSVLKGSKLSHFARTILSIFHSIDRKMVYRGKRLIQCFFFVKVSEISFYTAFSYKANGKMLYLCKSQIAFSYNLYRDCAQGRAIQHLEGLQKKLMNEQLLI